MTRQLWTSTCAALVFATAVAVAAQSSSAPQSPSPTTAPQAPATSAPQPPATSTPPTASPAPGQQAAEAQKVVVTGCLQAAPGTATAGAATTAEAPAGTAGSAESKPAGTTGESKFMLANATAAPSGATTSSTPTNEARNYQLVANESALAPHVGKKLELTGTVEEDTSGSGHSTPKLRVESGKIVAPSCMP
jgi:hypothetical protein